VTIDKFKHTVLAAGILSPLLAIALYIVVYGVLTSRSVDPEQDWLFRLSVSTAAMIAPSLGTLLLAFRAYRRQSLLRSGKVGLVIAVLSLGLALKPISDGILRSRQIRNMAMRNVAAPVFDTPDIFGNQQSLADQKGLVVLVNVWATWCAPCRAEMPELDQLYREQKDRGLMIFGLSDESVEVQKKYLQQVPITYPLLTLKGNVPSLYRDIARFPATFLIDRQGRLQPAPNPGQPFIKLQKAIDALLKVGSN
jgi:peroxiredoxin